MLRISNVSKTFGKNTPDEKQALQNFSLDIKNGDFVTIIGGNGAGKSTLFNTIAGTFFVDEGRIILDDENITFTQEYKRSQKIGRMFQDPLKGTAPNMTIEENLALAYLRAKGGFGFSTIKNADRDFFREKLERLGLGLENRMKTRVGLLSGGQRQALTLLMATLITPKLLLLDEHTAALDPATVDKVLTLTKDIISENKIKCLMITHNIKSALELGTRTIMMDAGRIVLDIQGEERKTMTVPILMQKFEENAKKALDNDRMLLG